MADNAEPTGKRTEDDPTQSGDSTDEKLVEGIMTLLTPIVQEMDTSIVSVRSSQEALSKEIERLLAGDDLKHDLLHIFWLLIFQTYKRSLTSFLRDVRTPIICRGFGTFAYTAFSSETNECTKTSHSNQPNSQDC